MRLLILLLLPTLVSAADFEVSSKAINKVIDGDTLKLNVRLAHIDTPEIRGKCANEIALAKLATEYTQSFIKDNPKLSITVADRGYYGRPLAEIRSGDRYLNSELVERGLAQWYKNKKPWCAYLSQ